MNTVPYPSERKEEQTTDYRLFGSQMRVDLPQYNGLDNKVMLIVTPIFIFFLNCIIFGTQYFSGFWFFISVSLLTFFWFCPVFISCGVIAVLLKQRFPSEAELAKRLSFMIVALLITTGLFLSALFNIFESIAYFEYRFNEKAFAWSYLVLGIISIFITFLMEGISRYKEWQLNRQATEKLNQVYKKSQLQGLKSQVNPHFLFNSLNSLSSLIQCDKEMAERFLDEMSKVYCYMLSSDEVQLVTLDTELKFADSYMFLLKARFGNGLQLKMTASEEDKTKLLAPLTLQLLIESKLFSVEYSHFPLSGKYP
ncbi:hypothetical protein KCTC52924_02758 [Arenibacter antarcticus]|uniref:Sensor histidine kinase n=1 Tax=Arenibacter antarcticus TaxID=2040469 RepID=A0ABW5VJQ0_9FLAO|nr:sensor histidine kinase [Arenibacter sp. H213]MCM4167178.1 hypothetical protein [Arenibacter sp. H213]